MKLSTKLVEKIKFHSKSSGILYLKKSLNVVTTQIKTRTESAGQREFLSVMFENFAKITLRYIKFKKKDIF